MKMDHQNDYFYIFEDEEFDIQFDFTNSLATSETLSSCTVSATDSLGETVTITKSVSTSSPYCYFTVYNTTADKTYQIKLTGTSSESMTYISYLTCECFGSVTLNANVADPDANSYVTVDEANKYIRNAYGHSSIWDELSLEGKKRLLIEAAREIDKLNFIDDKYYDNQAMEFPRDTHDVLSGDVATPCTINSFKNTSFTSDSYGSERSNSNYWKYGSVHITSGTPLYDIKQINTSNITTDVITTIANFSATPASGSDFVAFEPINTKIKDAQCEQALNIINNSNIEQLQQYGVNAKSVSIGDVSVSFKDGMSSSTTISSKARKLLSQWIQKTKRVLRA